jgi:hypothetical protein
MRNEAHEEGKSGFITNLDKEVFNAKRWLVICEDGNSSGMDRKCYE